MSFWDGVKKVFGFDGVGESALKIVDKIAGTDWTPKEQAQFILDHAEKTRYQSPTRRFIAILISLEWFLLATCWLISTITGRILESGNVLLIANDIQKFLASDVSMLINGIMAFYFLIGMKK